MAITKSQIISGGERGSIWRSRTIGVGSLSLSVRSFTITGHTFPSTAKLITVWAGAKLQLNVVGGTPPYAYASSAPDTAAVDSAGLVTLADSGSFTITVTDSDDKTATFTQSPTKFFAPAGVSVSQSTAAANCASMGGLQPAPADVTNSPERDAPGARAIGTLFGEWGDIKSAGFPAASYQAWTTTSGGTNAFVYADGSRKNTSTSSLTDGICLLDAAPLEVTAYYTSAGTTQEHYFPASDGSIKTVFDGAKIQIGDPVGIRMPFEWTSSDPAIAEISNLGLITWHAAGEVTFSVSDAAGRKGLLTLSPTLLVWSDGTGRTWPDANDFAIASGGRLAAREELTIASSTRGLGTFFAEWGSTAENGAPWHVSGRPDNTWTSSTHDGEHSYAIMTSGGWDETTDTAKDVATIVVFDSSATLEKP